MKAWLAVVALTMVPLIGCSGNSRELKRAQIEANTARKDADSMRAENKALHEKVTELEGEIASLTKERDDLKAVIEQSVTAPSAVPASGKKRKK